MLKVESFGRDNISNSLDTLTRRVSRVILKKHGESGVKKITSKTPVKTGKTASAWDYSMENDGSLVSLVFTNSNLTKDKEPVVALLVNGHGTGKGAYIPPNDFLTEVVDDIVDDILLDVERGLDGK